MEKKYIKASDIKNGCCDGEVFTEVKLQNLEAAENLEGKTYKYLGLVKSNTTLYGWRVTDGERYFAIVYTHYNGVSSIVYVYQTNKKGEYDIVKPIKEYPNYVDIETCADDFFANYAPKEEEFNYEEKEEELEEVEEDIDEDITPELI